MKQRCARLALLAITTWVAGCATSLGDSASLSQGAIDSAAALAPPASGSLPSVSEANGVVTVPYNLGIKGYSVERQRSSTLPNGLKETLVQGSSTLGSSQSSGMGRTVSLCGLVPLVIESGSPGSMGTLTFTGKADGFFAVGAAPATSVRQIGTALEASSRDLCRPSDGRSFSFKLTMKLETNIPPFRRVVDLVETHSCRASALAENHANLKAAGASLLLTCAISGGGLDRPMQKIFVYHPAAAEYFPVYLKINDGYFHEYSYTQPPQVNR